MVLEQKDTGYPESRRLSAFVCCFLAMFCYSPYLQHAFYHTTLFIGLTDKIDLSFAVSMASMVILLLASAVFWSKLRFIAHSWILMLLIAIISFIATASLYSTQLYGNIIPNIIIYCIAALYGMSLAVIGIQVIRLLCFQSLCSGFLVSSSAAISGQAISLVVFAVCLNAPYYDVMAVVGLPLTSCVLLFAVRHGLLRRPAEGLFLHKSHTGRRSRTILLSVSCLASLIAHVLLSFIYVAQPSLEYLGDAPLPLTVAFAFHMILLAAVVASVRRHASVIDYLFVPGLLLLAVIFIGILSISFFAYKVDTLYVLLGAVMSLSRAPNVLLLILIIILTGSGARAYHVLPSAFIGLAYCLPAILRYLLFPRLLMDETIDIQRQVGGVTFTLGVLTVVAITFFFMVLVFKTEGKSQVGQTQLVNTRLACCKELADIYGLTPRETDVLYWLSLGHTSKKISTILGITSGTVNTYLKSVYAKLDIHTRQGVMDLVDAEIEANTGK